MASHRLESNVNYYTLLNYCNSSNHPLAELIALPHDIETDPQAQEEALQHQAIQFSQRMVDSLQDRKAWCKVQIQKNQTAHFTQIPLYPTSPTALYPDYQDKAESRCPGAMSFGSKDQHSLKWQLQWFQNQCAPLSVLAIALMAGVWTRVADRLPMAQYIHLNPAAQILRAVMLKDISRCDVHAVKKMARHFCIWSRRLTDPKNAEFSSFTNATDIFKVAFDGIPSFTWTCAETQFCQKCDAYEGPPAMNKRVTILDIDIIPFFERRKDVDNIYMMELGAKLRRIFRPISIYSRKRKATPCCNAPKIRTAVQVKDRLPLYLCFGTAFGTTQNLDPCEEDVKKIRSRFLTDVTFQYLDRHKNVVVATYASTGFVLLSTHVQSSWHYTSYWKCHGPQHQNKWLRFDSLANEGRPTESTLQELEAELCKLKIEFFILKRTDLQQ